MATVTFSNGKKVSFNGTPTQQDIDEVSQKFGLSSGSNQNASASASGSDAAKIAPSPFDQDQNALKPDAGFIGDLQSGNYGGAAVNAAKNTGNFLFPIVGDAYHDVKGDSKKSFLQQTGDAALSALPFIPGLGEAGEVLKGAAEGTEGVADVAKSAGLIGKAADFVKGSTVAKGAITGYGAGVASNLSQGKGIGESLKPGLNTIVGAVAGGALPILAKGATSAVKGLAGIDPQIESELSKYGSQANPGDVSLSKSYIDAAKNHATNLTGVKPPLTMAADQVDKAAQLVQEQTDKAGAAVGEAKKAAAGIPLKPIDSIGAEFKKNVEDRYGLNLFSDTDGNVIAKPMDGSLRQIAPGDQARIENMATQLNKLYGLDTGATVKHASDVISNLNDLVDFKNQDVYGHSNDPLEGLIKNTAGNINGVVRDSSPSLAKANDTFSGLKDLQGEIKSMAGKNLQKGELLMKRLFSGDKSGDVQDFFQKVKDATGVDLVKHGVFARHAIDTVGSKADKTLLQQALEGATEGKGGLISTALGIGRKVLQKTVANPERIGNRLLQGKSGIISKVAPYATKGAIEVGSRVAKGLLGN